MRIDIGDFRPFAARSFSSSHARGGGGGGGGSANGSLQPPPASVSEISAALLASLSAATYSLPNTARAHGALTYRAMTAPSGGGDGYAGIGGASGIAGIGTGSGMGIGTGTSAAVGATMGARLPVPLLKLGGIANGGALTSANATAVAANGGGLMPLPSGRLASARQMSSARALATRTGSSVAGSVASSNQVQLQHLLQLHQQQQHEHEAAVAELQQHIAILQHQLEQQAQARHDDAQLQLQLQLLSSSSSAALMVSAGGSTAQPAGEQDALEAAGDFPRSPASTSSGLLSSPSTVAVPSPSSSMQQQQQQQQYMSSSFSSSSSPRVSLPPPTLAAFDLASQRAAAAHIASLQRQLDEARAVSQVHYAAPLPGAGQVVWIQSLAAASN